MNERTIERLPDLLRRLVQDFLDADDRAEYLERELENYEGSSWIQIEDKLPDVVEVRVKLKDGSQIECWSQSDGDFYWKGGGAEIFIPEENVTHWKPSYLQVKDS